MPTPAEVVDRVFGEFDQRSYDAYLEEQERQREMASMAYAPPGMLEALAEEGIHCIEGDHR